MAKAAKKRKKEEDEEFHFPEFDEHEYLTKEVELSKATFVTIGLAIPVGVLLYGLTLVNVPVAAFFLGIAVTFLLPRFFPRLPWPKLDLTKFERKDWFGQGGTFFFAWFTVWILLLNLPFSDVTPPVFGAVTASDGPMTLTIVPNAQNGNLTPGTIWINASVYENGGLERVTLDVPGSSLAMSSVGSSLTTWSKAVTLTAGSPTVTLTATDHAGLVSAFSFTLIVS